MGNIVEMCCKLPKSSVHLHHISPSKSNKEMYINKHKVVLLDQDEVKAHHEETHHMHIEHNSPFKQCLITNFGYKDVIRPIQSTINGSPNNGKIPIKLRKKAPHHLNGFMGDSIKYSSMKTDTHSNGHHQAQYDHMAIEMTTDAVPTANHHPNGSTTNHPGESMDDGKVEEEAVSRGISGMTGTSGRKGTSSRSSIHIAIDDERGRSRNNTRGTILEDEEVDEHKYEMKEEVASSDENEADSNEKSKSRHDGNVDQEHLYTAYDDEEDEEEDRRNGRLSLNMGAQYQYSRSVTPDYTHSGTQPMAQTPPQPLLGGMNNNNGAKLELDTLTASPRGKRKKRSESGAPMSTVPSESPGSAYRTIEE